MLILQMYFDATETVANLKVGAIGGLPLPLGDFPSINIAL